jgi:hypothetical protein
VQPALLAHRFKKRHRFVIGRLRLECAQPTGHVGLGILPPGEGSEGIVPKAGPYAPSFPVAGDARGDDDPTAPALGGSSEALNGLRYSAATRLGHLV